MTDYVILTSYQNHRQHFSNDSICLSDTEMYQNLFFMADQPKNTNLMKELCSERWIQAEVLPTNLSSVEANELRLDNLFLLKDNSLAMETQLKDKIRENKALTIEEQMEFVILPLTYKGKEEKQACIRRCFEMAKTLEDEGMQRFLLSGMLVFADKVITMKDSIRIKEWIMMTKIGQLFEEEKIQYGEEREREAAKGKEVEFAEKMLLAGLSVKKVSEMMSILKKKDVQKIAEKIDL